MMPSRRRSAVRAAGGPKGRPSPPAKETSAGSSRSVSAASPGKGASGSSKPAGGKPSKRQAVTGSGKPGGKSGEPKAKAPTAGGPRTSRPNDHFGAKAKKEGYPARSVYKLEEIDRRVRLLRPGMRVLDLGAFPGSWTMYAAKKIAPQGRVIGIDILENRDAIAPNAEMRQADIFTVDPATLGRFDVVLTDMAPSTIGSRAADQYNSYLLFMAAVKIAEVAVAPGGSFVGKIFQGAEFEDARKSVRVLFETVRIIKPEASRKESFEVFLVGLGRKPALA